MGAADNYRAYLKTEAGGSYTSSESLNNNPPNDGLWCLKKKYYTGRASILRRLDVRDSLLCDDTYSANIYFGANRYMNVSQWDLITFSTLV